MLLCPRLFCALDAVVTISTSCPKSSRFMGLVSGVSLGEALTRIGTEVVS